MHLFAQISIIAEKFDLQIIFFLIGMAIEAD